MRTDFGASFIPGEHQGSALTTMLDQLVTWSTALVGVRAGSAASSA
ncbi:hypothetical protein OG571_41995 [Streptomyces sp. NBC_01369]